MDAVTGFIALVAQAFPKIMIMLIGVFIAFLAIPQSRAAAAFGIAIMSAFAGGILVQLYSVQSPGTSDFIYGLVCFGTGLIVFPFLSFFKKFNDLVDQDKEIVELVFNAFKKFIKRFVRSRT
jgi:hypothetical protein